MKLNYEHILAKANQIYRNEIADKYKEGYPDLDMNMVKLHIPEDVLALFASLIESINEQSK